MLKSTLPVHPRALKTEDCGTVADYKMNKRQKQKFTYDKTAKPRKALQERDRVRLHGGRSWSKTGMVVGIHLNPMSYMVKGDDRTELRRNRIQLQHTPTEQPAECNPSAASEDLAAESTEETCSES